MKLIPIYSTTTVLLSLALVAGTAIAGGAQSMPPEASAPPTLEPALAEPPQVAQAPQVVETPVVFATVGEHVITQDEYNAALNIAAGGKFYHGKPPEGALALLQREVADKLVVALLLQHEATHRGLHPDAAEIQKKLEAYDQRYASSEQWKTNRAQLLPPVQARFEQESLVSQLEKTIRSGIEPSEMDIKAYYAAHLPKFTEPEQMRVSVILLKVDPSSPAATWLKADEQAQAIARQARAGEDFAALARQHSVDESAQQGGDMGYLHSGMLTDSAELALAKMKTGEISDAVRLLEGFAVFRLSDRKPAKLHEFDAVKVRAQELAQQKQSDEAWTALIADLKIRNPAKIDPSRFLPLPEPATTPATPATPASHGGHG